MPSMVPVLTELMDSNDRTLRSQEEELLMMEMRNMQNSENNLKQLET